MARCRSCSAPLRPNDANCLYCGVRNSLDLHGHSNVQVVKPETDRICPDCDTALQTIDLKIDGRFYVERCDACFGLFFDSGEVDLMLEKSTSHVYEVNRERLGNISADRSRGRQDVRYRKCPVCKGFMSRKNFGQRSGVVIDRCNNHGIWLDNGELVHLLEWKKAGGARLHSDKGWQSTDSTSGSGDASARATGSAAEPGFAGFSQRRAGPPDLEDLVSDALSSLISVFRR